MPRCVDRFGSPFWLLPAVLLFAGSMAPSARAQGIAFYPPVAVGVSPLLETSGIAESRLHPGTLWIHNDSGNPGVLYGVNYQGQTVASYNFGSQNDWEDVAVGPGTGGASSIFIGDTGDNTFNRQFARIIRFVEPATLTSSPTPIHTSQYDRGLFQYPNGPQDVEALTVDPITGDIFLFSKGATPQDVSYVYRATQSIFDPLPSGTYHQIELITSLSILSRITAGDISPDGQYLLLRSRSTTAYLYRRQDGQSFAEAILSTPTPVALASEPQGEAIGWAADGSGFFTASERENQPIYFYERARMGDANLDRQVDAADYTIWADHYGLTGQPWGAGDFNGDGIVDSADFTLWADNFSPGIPAAAQAAEAVAAPEPASWALMATGVACGLLAGRIGRRVRATFHALFTWC